jgi:hypothetical protein
VIAAGTVVTPVHGPFAVVLSLSAVVWLVLELRQGITRRPEAAKSDRGSLMVLRPTLAVAWWPSLRLGLCRRPRSNRSHSLGGSA